MSSCPPKDYKKLIGSVVIYNDYNSILHEGVSTRVLKNSYLIYIEDMVQAGKNQMYQYKMRVLNTNLLLDKKFDFKDMEQYPFKFSSLDFRNIYESTFNVYCRDVYYTVHWSKSISYDLKNYKHDWISFDCWLRDMSEKVNEMQNLIQPIARYANVQLPS